MAKKDEPTAAQLAPGAPEEPEDAPNVQFVVLSDNFAGGEKGKRVSMPATPQTQILVDSGHLKPASAAAKDALS